MSGCRRSELASGVPFAFGRETWGTGGGIGGFEEVLRRKSSYFFFKRSTGRALRCIPAR
jgi:hypothetical protein